MTLAGWEALQRKRSHTQHKEAAAEQLREPLLREEQRDLKRERANALSEPQSHDHSSSDGFEATRLELMGTVRHVRSTHKLPSLITRKSDQSRRSNGESQRSQDDSSSSSRQHRHRRRAQPHRVPVVNPGDLAGNRSPPNDPMDCAESFGDFGAKRSALGAPTRRLPRGLSFAAVERGHAFNPAFTIRHKWLEFSHKFDFWFRDRFHVLLSLSFKSLVCVLVLAEFLWAATLAVILGIVTRGDVEHCLGGFVTHWIHYYYFTVETMFTVGFGEPRYPSCTAANMFVSFAVMLTNVLHGTLIGLVFSKFSSGTGRRWAIAFSPELCGAVVGTLIECEPDMISKVPMDSIPRTLAQSSPTIHEHLFESHSRNCTATAPARRSRITHSRRSDLSTPSRRSAETVSERVLGPDELSERSPGPESLDRLRARRRDIRGMSFHFGAPSSQLTRNYQHLYTSTGIKRSTFASRVHCRPRIQETEHYDHDSRFSTHHRASMMAPSLGYIPRPPFSPSDEVSRSGPGALTLPPDGKAQVRSTPSEALPPAASTPTPSKLEDFEKPGIGFSLSFRLMNLTDSSFFDPKLSIFLLLHDQFDLTITQILRYHTDVPLEFLELPVTVTVDSRDPESPLNSVSLPDLVRNGHLYEFMVLLTFVDNQSSRTIELRKSWRLSSVTWGKSFRGIVKRERPGAYEIDVEALDSRMVLVDPLNKSFVAAMRDDLHGPSGNVNIKMNT